MSMEEHKTKSQLRAAVQRQTIAFMTAALSLVAGLAWNDAIQTLIQWMWPTENGGSLVAKFVYAIVLTCTIVVITVQLQKLAEKE